MTVTAEVREAMIRAKLQEAIDALQRGLRDIAREHFVVARELIAGRDRMTVRQLEFERGLAERRA